MVPGIESRSEQSPFTRRVPGSNPKTMDHSLMKRVLWDSKPGSDAYVTSAQNVDGTLNSVANKASARTGAHSRDPKLTGIVLKPALKPERTIGMQNPWILLAPLTSEYNCAMQDFTHLVYTVLRSHNTKTQLRLASKEKYF
ncbi:hypothetical protein DPMN_065970 [Dreissena polymorpha]|uniref:Uncharacterized protein n=1 Tax=Dreissena polymorpha TaxID=45954 RepID=A0A9D3YUJ2_DREPO|nr:hypothetical protein DPMN_065970 [Dreissena polymorpha]